MRPFWILVLLLVSVISPSLSANAKEARTEELSSKEPHAQLTPSANPQGLWGAKDAAGNVIIPFKYSYAHSMADGYIQVGLPSKTNQRSPNDYGVMNAQGQTVLPIKYHGIDYLDDKKRFKVVVTTSKGQDKFGVLDMQGKVVVPVMYDYLERISNMGDEPTNLMKLNGKTGYINIVTGEVLIKPIYDRLYVTSLNTDPQGAGLGTATLKDKWGVLATNGQVVVPFEYDFIAELSVIDGRAIATKQDKLLQLNFKKNQFINSSEVATRYSSNFVPRFFKNSTPKPYDGFYVAQDYPNMKAAFDGWQANQLRWIAMPSFQVSGDEVHVSFGIFNDINLPLLPNVMALNRQANGFTLLNDFDSKADPKIKPEKWLSFTPVNDGLKCNECEQLGLPVIWKSIKQAPTQPFGGIGVAISKLLAEDEMVSVDDVLKGGPAYSAGLRAHDYIVAIDGKPVAADSIDQVRDKLRGPEGSQVKVKYIRGGRAHEAIIIRAVISQK